MLHEELIAKAVEGGASKATVIRTENIVMSTTFRDICKSNGCGMYGKCWMCPPDIGDVEELMARIRSYEYGLLYQTIGEIEDSYDFEGMGEVGKHHEQVSIQVEALLRPLLPAHWHLGCGGCHLCERCARLDDQPCRHPDLAVPAMEGCGIDVYNTTKPTELKYINGQNTVTYFGLILF